jgi:uncharacterized repeat protein (TIGR02543 family)
MKKILLLLSCALTLLFTSCATSSTLHNIFYNDINIIYITNSNTIIEPQTITVDYDSTKFKLEEPNSPTKEGYIFNGWYTTSYYSNSSYIDFSDSQEVPMNSDFKIYAKWIKIPIVTFETNSETKITPQTAESYKDSYTNSVTFTLKEPKTPIKEGYFFDGWYTDAKFNDTIRFNHKITKDTILHAKWIKIPIATFETNFETKIEPQEAKIKKNSYSGSVSFTFEQPKTLINEGYIFEGWYTDTKYTNLYRFDRSITKDTTFYAKWIKIPIVTFETYSETKITPQIAESYKGSYSVTFTFKEPKTPINKGYFFDGWYTDTKYTKKLTKLTITEDTILHAKWIKIPIATFETNFETKIEPQEAKISKSSYPSTVNFTFEQPKTPINGEYAFEGWYTDKKFTNYFNFENKIFEDIILYAKWIKTPIATFDTNSETKIEPQVAQFDKKNQIYSLNKPINPKKKGYDFDGWYTDTGRTNLYLFDESIEKDTTFYAKWIDPKLSKWTIENVKDVFGDDTGEYYSLYKERIYGTFTDIYGTAIKTEVQFSFDKNNGLKIDMSDKVIAQYLQNYFYLTTFLPVSVDYKTNKDKNSTMTFLVKDKENNISIISNPYSNLLELSLDDRLALLMNNFSKIDLPLIKAQEVQFYFTFMDSNSQILGTLAIPKLDNSGFYSVIDRLGII